MNERMNQKSFINVSSILECKLLLTMFWPKYFYFCAIFLTAIFGIFLFIKKIELFNLIIIILIYKKMHYFTNSLHFCKIFLIHLLTILSILPSTLFEWSPWNAWSLCYEQNGINAQTRTRAWHGDPGKNPGNDMQAKACLPGESKPLPPPKPAANPPPSTQPILVMAQSEWTQWTEWSECQSLPGGSSPPFRSRWRICDRRKCDVAQGTTIGGSSTKVECQPCVGQPMEQQNCPIPSPSSSNNGRQNEPPTFPGINIPSMGECQWSDWSNWSSCSTTCGTGIRIRMRICPCSRCPAGPSQEEENCYNLLPCSTGDSSGHLAPPPPPPPPIVPWNFGADWVGGQNWTILPGGIPPSFNPCNYCPPMYALPCYTCLVNGGGIHQGK